MRTRDILRAAKRDGAKVGKNSAGWCFDGNTSDSTYRRVLKGIEDGDPEVLDRFTPPNLDDPKEGDPCSLSLAGDYDLIDLDTAGPTKQGERILDDVCSTWEGAALNAFWGEIERTCRTMLS